MYIWSFYLHIILAIIVVISCKYSWKLFVLLHSDTEVPSLGGSWLQVKSLAYTSVKGTVDGTYLAQHETPKLQQVPLSQYYPNIL